MKKLAILLLVLAPLPLAAQPEVIDLVDELEIEEPEAWAMSYFASASLMTGLGAVEKSQAGEVELGLELLQVPSLDAEQRRVGFGGFKEEELNRAPVWARLRVDIGLPAGFGLSLGVVPPVELDGVKATLVAVALERALVRTDHAGLGLRAYAQKGDVEGDLTCKEGEDHLFPVGSAQNPFGCQAPSEDEVQLDYYGLELVGDWRPSSSPRVPTLHAGVSWNHLDLEFQVDALTFGLRDRTLLLADGDTIGLTAGATWTLGDKSRLSAELFYSALDVIRPGQEQENDALFNLRLAYRYQIR
jgi:hypothetical protein